MEDHYKSPMDIEWAIRGGNVYILQARPITTLDTDTAEEEAKLIHAYIKDSKISGVMKENMSFQLEKVPYAYRPLDYDFIMKINTQTVRIFSENGIEITSDPQIDDDGIMTLRFAQCVQHIIKLYNIVIQYARFIQCFINIPTWSAPVIR